MQKRNRAVNHIVNLFSVFLISLVCSSVFASEKKHEGVLLAAYSLGCIYCAEHFSRLTVLEQYAEQRNLKLIIEAVPSKETEDMDIIYNYAKIYLPKGQDNRVMRSIFMGLSLKSPMNDRGYLVEFLNIYAPVENLDWRHVLKNYSDDKKIKTKIWYMADFALNNNLTETPSYYVIKGNKVTQIASPIVIEKKG